MTEWKEIRLPKGADIDHYLAFYRRKKTMAFFDEPWHPGCWILRVKGEPDRKNEVEWSEKGDIGYLGQAGFDLLCQASKARDRTPGNTNKFIHCQLNTWGYTRWDEFKFALSYAISTLWMVVVPAILGDGDKAALAGRRWLGWTRVVPKHGRK